jgi:nicotinamide-nucleotide amidase
LTPDFSTLVKEAAALLEDCRNRRLTLATAESCTGGLIAAALTEVPGSSDVFERGFVTYSNAAKVEQLGVPAEVIERRGAVSEEVAHAMAMGAIEYSSAGLAIAVTGVAGPGGGSREKPVGLVHIAAASRTGKTAHREIRFGDIERADIRRRSVQAAFELVRSLL